MLYYQLFSSSFPISVVYSISKEGLNQYSFRKLPHHHKLNHKILPTLKLPDPLTLPYKSTSFTGFFTIPLPFQYVDRVRKTRISKSIS